MNSSSAIRSTFFYILLTAAVVLTFKIFLPYIITLSVATAFAVVCQPLHQALIRMVRGKTMVASILTILAVSILVLAPLTLIGMKIAQEGVALYAHVNEENYLGDNALNTIETFIETQVRQYIPTFDLEVETLARQSLGWFSSHVGSFFANTLQILLHFFLGIIAFYYLLKDGPSFVARITELSPLKDTHDRKIFNRLTIAINSILKGSLLIAVIQGITTGIGFAIFGIPSATLWGGLAAIGALIPGVGTAIVIAPAILYLFISGKTIAAIGLLIWGATAVGMIDNFLGPMLVGRGVRIHPLFIMFAAIGGIQFFGPPGFILGPLTLSLLYALLDIYQIIASDKNTQTL